MYNNLNQKKIEFKIIFIISLLFFIGLILISSATKFDQKRLLKQTVSFSLGFIFIFFSKNLDYRFIKLYEKHLYFITIILLVSVFIPGIRKSQFGTYRWINLGFMDFQTSEAAKITFTLAYCSFLEKRRNSLNNLKEIIPVLLYPLPMILLLLKQPDLGGAIVFIFIIFIGLFISGINIKFIFYSFITILLSTPIIYKFILREHQKIRIDAFLNPGNSSFQGNYQVMRSITAIGSGGIIGKGIFNGSISQYGFLPVTESDFIFALLGEELGFLGMTLVILLFLILFFKIYCISKNSKDFYGELITTCFLGMLFYQVFQNIGMTMGIMPVTGLTLPLISYGGSSMLTTMTIFALILNVNTVSKNNYYV